MRRRLSLLAVALTCVLAPRVSMADIVKDDVQFYAVWDDANGSASWDIQKNELGYSGIWWENTGSNNPTVIAIDNIQNLDLYKLVWLEIDYSSTPPSQLPTFFIDGYLTPPPPGQTSEVFAFDPVINGNSVTWKWRLTPQPDEEKIFLGSSAFHNLTGIDQIAVATLCVPLPAAVWPSLSVLGCVIGGIAYRRWRVVA